MAISDPRKTPFPWFGGKADAADVVWQALGDVGHYVEPFAGSLAVLMRRPHEANRPYYSETVNDMDGLLVNFWRALAADPDAVADAASWPVSEVDLMARHLALVERKAELVGRMRADPDHYDATLAGWWVWGQSSWIGSGWCSGTGPWCVDHETGGVRKQGRGKTREPGVESNRPHLSDNGRGVNAQTLREPGVKSQLPFLSSDGRGVNHASLREPGVESKLPHLTSDGRGVNSQTLREPGVASKLPHLTNNGSGVNAQTLREPGVASQLPHLSDNGQGVNHASLREPGVGEVEWHPMTMPELRNWLGYLSARLRHVRIIQGDWKRACTNGATKTLSVRKKGGTCGVFLDPPYAGAVRTKGVYAHDSDDVAEQVRDWCLGRGEDPKTRIVLAGFTGEGHEVLVKYGWTEIEWYKGGYLKGGMGNVGGTGNT